MTQRDGENKIFEYAAAFVKQTNRHIFLTGKAGTGKTTFLKYIRENCGKKMAVVAPTGVAAINAGGVTIHSFFLLPLGIYIHNHRSAWGESESHVFNRNQLLSKMRFNQNKRELLRELELLVIDEISMVRADVLDAVDMILRSVRRRLHEPFGGVQVLYIGDLFQLPPVVRQQEKPLMDSVYNSPFFFDSMVVKQEEPLFIELKTIYRQQDKAFIRVLNNIRNNHVTEEDLEILHEHYDPYFEPDREDNYITLTSHNYQADDINRRELERLTTLTYQIEAEVLKEFPETAYPADKVLRLKEGAQIMFIKNDKGELRRYYNGKIGTIERIDDDGKKIWIRFKDDPELLELEKETWRNIRYKYDNENDEVDEEVLGSFTQYPVRLAWAVTIHKSQGLTFEKAIVDAGQSFAPGQVYVALSRLTGLEGLVLRSRITAAAIMTDERIIEFSKNEMNDDVLQHSLRLSQREYVGASLIKAFDFEKLQEQIQAHFQETNFRKLTDGELAMNLFAKLSGDIDTITTTTSKFLPQLQHFLSSGETYYPQLLERMRSAVGWFEKNMKEQVTAVLRAHVNEWKIKPKAKKYSETVRAILLVAERKEIQLTQALLATEGLTDPQKWNEALEAVSHIHAPATLMVSKEEPEAKAAGSKSQKGFTKQVSFEMYQQGKSVADIARERSMAESTIFGHLAEFVGTGHIPVSDFVSLEKLPVILNVFQKMPNALHGDVKSALGEDYSYPEIKAAHQYLKFMESKAAEA